MNPNRELSLFFEAISELEKEITNAPSVEDLADHLAISLSSLKRLFANLIGMGVHEYLIERKIRFAKQYLKDGHSVTETAERCGFSNQAYFSASFKKAAGHTPKEFLGKEATILPKEFPCKIQSKRNAKLSSLIFFCSFLYFIR